MKLAHYLRNGETRVGLVDEGLICDLDRAVDIDTILVNGLLPSIQKETGKGIAIESVKLQCPILRPEKILLVAINYASHSKERKVAPHPEPYFFTKFRNSLIGPDDPIIIPRVSKMVDWEAELAIIIGRAGKNIPKKNAMDYVAGYAVANDVSFRDLQYSTVLDGKPSRLGLNWVKGKGLDNSFPLGPWLVTKDEVDDPSNLEIVLKVNGETKQRSNTNEMIFGIDSLIEYASAGMTLKPGDIISTGTPEGVAYGTGGVFLRDGDLVEVEISNVGTLRNPVRLET